MTNSQRQVVWLCGKQASGKTFAGDYLQTRGWHHVDGELGKTSDDAAVQKAWADLFEGYLAKGKGESCPEGCWIPYYEYLAGEIERGLETNDRVVTTFAMMGLFDGDEEFLRSRFPDIKFVAIECETSELLNRWYARCEKIFGQRGMTMEDGWKSESDFFRGARAAYGDVYSKESFMAYSKRVHYDTETISVKQDPAKNCYVIRNDDLEGNQAIKALDGLFGLDGVEVDKDKIAKVFMDRMKKME